MGVFKVSDDGYLELSKEECRAIPEYRAMLEADKGCEGDNDGRKKLYSFRLFKFIFFMCDNNSPYINAPDDERIKKSLRDAELPPDFNYRKSKLLVIGMRKYQDIQEVQSPSAGILAALERGLNVSKEVVNAMVNNIQKALVKMTTALEENPNADINIDTMVAAIDKLNSMATNIPKSIDSIEAIREKVKKEAGDRSIIRSGRSLGNREDVSYLKERTYKEEEDDGS